MFLILFLALFLLCLIVSYFVHPFIKRYEQLQKDYRNISPLQLSSIPYLGNIGHFTGKPQQIFQLLNQLSRQCQDENKGLFCIWFCLWPSIILCSAEGLERFINNSRQLVKSFDYTFVEPWLKTGLLTSNNEKWRSRRRLITPSFHNNQLLNSFMLIFNEQANILVDRLNQLSFESKQTHYLYPFISACTLDIIAEAATGTHPQAQSGDQTNEYVNATIRMGEIVTKRSRTPWMWPSFIFNILSIGREQKKALEILHRFSREVIEERLKTFDVDQTFKDLSETKKDARRLVFLDSLIMQMHAEKLTIADIQEEVDTFMFEGHDTTAVAIQYLLYLVGSHPEVQAKIHQEIDSIFEDDQNRMCTMDDIQKLNYLDCVIKESLRLLPSVPFIAREAQEDFNFRGQTIRKGTTVAISIYGIHHDGNVYANPDQFDPSRFSDSSIIERSPYDFIPFSAGSRNCIGQRFAGLEERVILSVLFRHFSFHSNQTIDDLALTSDVLLRTAVPIEINIKRRDLS